MMASPELQISLDLCPINNGIKCWIRSLLQYFRVLIFNDGFTLFSLLEKPCVKTSPLKPLFLTLTSCNFPLSTNASCVSAHRP